MKLLALVLLTLTTGVQFGKGPPPPYECTPTMDDTELTTCGEFKITKTAMHYIQQCTLTESCMPQNIIKCKDICGVCGMIPGIDHEESCNKDKSTCETAVDTFLQQYCTCSNATHDQCAPSTTEADVSRECINDKIEATTVKIPTEITTEQCSCSDQTVEAQTMEASTKVQATILGALLGLLIMILALVITGWVWTCWTMKKWRDKSQLCTQCQDHEEKRSYPNPTYDMTTASQPVVGTATQPHSPEVENRQTHNVLNRNDDKGHSDINNTSNFHGNEICNHLDLQDNRTMIIGEEGENGEKHLYHILEKSGDDDYEDPDKDLRENRATDYEIPVPLEEI